MTPVLLPLYGPPPADATALRAVTAARDALTVVIDDPGGGELARTLSKAGVTVLGRVDAGFATRPVADLLDEVDQWARHPVSGILLDQAPTSPFSLGPVALATRVARRAGLATVVLNPGVPTDPLYRELGAPICTFEGSWMDYQRWTAEGSADGDGHLVHSVPPEAFAAARDLLRARRAGFGLVTDRTPPSPYDAVPAWLAARG